MPHQCTTCGHVFDDGSKEMLSGCPDCGGNTFQFHPKGTEIPETPPDADPPDPEGSTAANTVGRAATKVRDFVSSDDGSDPDSDSAAGAPETPPTDPGRAGGTRDSAGTVPSAPSGTSASTATDSGPDPNATWPSERDGRHDTRQAELAADDDGIIDADAREAARAVGEADEAAADPDPDAEAEAAAEASVDPDAEPASSESTVTRTELDPDTPSGADAGPLTETERSRGDTEAGADGAPEDGRVVSEPDGDQPDISELREQLNDQFESIKILEPGQYELNLMELYDREEYIIALQENGRYVIQVPEQWLGDQPGDA